MSRTRHFLTRSYEEQRRFPSYKTIPGDNCNGVGEVSLLSLEDMVRLAIDTIPAARDAEV